MIAHALSIRQPALLSTGAPMLLDVPDADLEEWKRDVEEEERARLRELWACFQEMLAARSLKAGSEAAAMRRKHLGWGWSAKALRSLFCAYRDGGYKPGDHRRLGARFAPGDWRILLRTYKGKDKGALPPEFVTWLGGQWAEFKGRDDIVNATWRHVVYDVWLKGQPIPGYGTIEEWCRARGRARPHPRLVRQSELPAGWSEATFRRHLPKRETTRQLVAHGYLAAHSSQPDQVLTDRSPLRPMEYIFLDDSRPDFRCTWFGPGGRGELVYPLLVMGLDACSGVDLEAVTKPRALKDDGSGRHGVTTDMALRVVCGVLRRFGLPPWPITFVHENAAACVPAEAKHILQGLYGDRIKFEATSIVKERLLAHGFGEQGGAPYDKAPIEAFWRILMTTLARLPGSTGPRYDTQPAELVQIEKYTLGLMEQAGGIEEIFKKFRSPLLDFAAADEAMMDALRMLRFRTQHKLQGFERVREFRASPAERYQPWDAFVALSVDRQNAIATNGDPHALIHRLECPAERFCRLLKGHMLTPVDDDLLLWIEGPRERARVRNGKITVERTELTDDAMIFRETGHPLLGEEHEGHTFDVVIARDGSRIVLAEEGRILGSVARQDRISRADREAIQREMGRVRAARVADREHLRGYLLGDADEAVAELRAHNEMVQAALPAPAAAPEKPKLAAGRRRQERRASIDQEIAAAARQAAQPAEPKGSLYDA